MGISCADLGRASVSTLIATLLGLIVWLGGYVAGMVDGSVLWAFVLLVGMVGLGCGIGHLLIRRASEGEPGAQRRGARWLVWSTVAVAVALPFGVLMGASYTRHAYIAPLTFLALAAAETFVAGLLIGHSAALQTHFSAFTRGFVAAITGVVHGYAFGLAYGVVLAASYHPTCDPHGFCLEPDPLFGLKLGLFAGPIAGLALGITAALALTVAYGARRNPAGSRRAAAT